MKKEFLIYWNVGIKIILAEIGEFASKVIIMYQIGRANDIEATTNCKKYEGKLIKKKERKRPTLLPRQNYFLNTVKKSFSWSYNISRLYHIDIFLEN